MRSPSILSHPQGHQRRSFASCISKTVQALALPGTRAKLVDLGLEAIGDSPDEFAVVIKSAIPKWAKVIQNAGIKPD